MLLIKMEQEHKNFDKLVNNLDILKGLYLNNFNEPALIQVKGITAINTGSDCIIQSQSGTGKTITFLLGCINRILPTGRALIMTPTRELANQIYYVACSIIKYSNLKIALCVGGTEIKQNTKYNENIIIGTTGRINHMISCKKLDISSITCYIIVCGGCEVYAVRV